MARKLAGGEVQKIKGLIAQGERIIDIAQECKVPKELVLRIKKGKRYKTCPVPKKIYTLHIAKKDRFVVPRAKRNTTRKLNMFIVMDIKELIANTTLSNEQLAKVFEVSRQTIGSLHGYGHRTWKKVPMPKKTERQSNRKLPTNIIQLLKLCLEAEVLTDKEIALAFDLGTTYVNDRHKLIRQGRKKEI